VQHNMHAWTYLYLSFTLIKFEYKCAVQLLMILQPSKYNIIDINMFFINYLYNISTYTWRCEGINVTSNTFGHVEYNRILCFTGGIGIDFRILFIRLNTNTYPPVEHYLTPYNIVEPIRPYRSFVQAHST